MSKINLEVLLHEYSLMLDEFYVLVSNSSQPELLGWESKYTQTERFRIILEEAQTHFALVSTDTLIDIGCGYADLYQYMLENNIYARYTGVDISDGFLTKAQSKYPELRFMRHNILDLKSKGIGSYDIVCMSGVLNLNLESRTKVKDANFIILLNVLEKLVAMSKKGVVCNFLSDNSSSQDSLFNYYNPRVLIKRLSKHGYKVLGLREKYLPNDFTLTIQRNINTQVIKTSTLEIYIDGGCSGNPGIGAWAFYAPKMGIEKSGNELETTNNRMELSAAYEALKWIKKTFNNSLTINIYTDSQYVQKGITTWISAWKKNNWKTSSKQAVKNQDLWKALDSYTQNLLIEWHWIEGHAGHEGNEKAHSLVEKSMLLLKNSKNNSHLH